jgi:hypothetical protein
MSAQQVTDEAVEKALETLLDLSKPSDLRLSLRRVLEEFAASAPAVSGEWVMVPESFVTAVSEFLADWEKGDFSLSTLAALDAQAIVEAKEKWAERLASAPARGEPVAYRHEMTEPDDKQAPRYLYSGSKNNPWSHWMEEHLGKCRYVCTPLYAAPSAVEDAAS